MDGAGHNNPRTVEEVFRDFKGRRNGLIKALTAGKFEISARISFFSQFLSIRWLLRVNLLAGVVVWWFIGGELSLGFLCSMDMLFVLTFGVFWFFSRC